MTPGITFNRGVKTLKLDKSIINDAIQFPDGFSFKKEKREAKFFNNFKCDVTRFDEKVAHHTQSVYEAATREIATWILKNPKKQTALSVFSPKDTTIRNVRTALVQCNFTEISQLILDFRTKIIKIMEDSREEKGEEETGGGGSYTEVIVTENDAIHEVIDKISDTNPDSYCIVMIRQFESLRPRFLDSLITLIFSNPTCRSLIPRIRLMICVSTAPAYFTQNCEIETLNLMEVKQFKFTKLDDIFSKVISTGVHKFFKEPIPIPKKLEDDDAQLLRTFDCAPAVFSGAFIEYLQNRFYACDYSKSALIRAVQFALLQKYLEDPLWREDPHTEELEKYDAVLELFVEEFLEEPAEFLNMHMDVQTDKNFWEKIREKEIFREKKGKLFENRKNLLSFCERILEKTDDLDENFGAKMKILKKSLEEAEMPKNPSENAENAPEKRKTMTVMDLRKQQEQAMQAKKQNPISTAKNAIFAHVFSFFEKILKPYPATWRNVIHKASWSPASLDSSDEYDIEHCLLKAEKNADHPLAVAWRTLLCHRNFKMVPMDDWAQLFLENTNMSAKQAKGAFFAAAGQLEYIGLIRGAADRKSTNVNVLYHPISFIPSL